jgi:hypothetical protein
MTCQRPESFNIVALTESDGHFERCSNPVCNSPMHPKRKHAPVKWYCSTKFRMDGYVLRRAREMIFQIGIVQFNVILEKFSESRKGVTV